VNIQTGPKLFEFASKQEWINKAQRIWRFHNVRGEETILVDRLGRIVRIGKDFATAERDDAYPIEVFLARQDMAEIPAMRAAQQQKDGGR
jgi:hypothetical protein